MLAREIAEPERTHDTVPNLKAWLSRCLDRPAAREALALKNKADCETPVEVTRRIARNNRL